MKAIATMIEKNQTYDTPWKQIIEFFFPQFMEFFVPGSKEDIDWNSKIKFLDKEFQKITKESVSGQKHTDKLIEVTLKNRSKKWILIHIVENRTDKALVSKRLFKNRGFESLRVYRLDIDLAERT